MRHVLQQQLFVFHVRQLTSVHHGLLGEGLERKVRDLAQVGGLLLCSVATYMSVPTAARKVVDGVEKLLAEDRIQWVCLGC